MIEPLPNCFSIWESAAASAFALLSSIADSFRRGWRILNYRLPLHVIKTRRPAPS
jgi:hypothetical protein